MKVQVKLTKNDDWQEVEVVGFYDPSKHKTVRLDGSTKKIPYAFMKMMDGRVYDKEESVWVLSKPASNCVSIDGGFETLPYEAGSITTLTLNGSLERSKDLVGCLKECHRVLATSGSIRTSVYLASSLRAFSDPEVINYFTEETFQFFLKGRRYDLFSNISSTMRGDILEVTLKK